MNALGLRGQLLRSCHPKQRAFVESTAKRCSACCSRRAGKSTGILVKHTLTALDYPGETSFYINRSVGAGEAVLGPAMRALRRDGIDLGLTHRVLKGRTYLYYPNGHRIWVAGCRDRSEIDAFRGQPPPRVTVDEAQQFPFLRELIEDAVEPGLLDFDGSLDLIGTPAPVPTGFFYETSQGGTYENHHWTMLDNPFLPNVAEWLERLRNRNGWTESTPRYVREYLGRWILDGEALVYPIDKRRNGWVAPPTGSQSRVLGVDLGSTGITALVVVSTVSGAPGYWVEHVETLRDASVSQVCDAVVRVQSSWPILRVVVDAGGLGGGYVRELQLRHGINATPAKKQDKFAYIEHLRSDILSGLVHVREDALDLWDEAQRLQWDDSRRGYDDRLPDHCLDAMLYAWRYLRPETETHEPDELVPGSPEYLAEEQRRAREQRARDVRRMLARK